MSIIKYPANIHKSRKKICSSQHCNGENSFLYANGVNTNEFKKRTQKTLQSITGLNRLVDSSLSPDYLMSKKSRLVRVNC